ncbi:uncharacterized protein LOC107271665 isoform X2 [Cephus cinctus]|uniref:Uncharacterized protein LOC107271665 isoform X2 n=1 Tax=Cephus cinctus TaxID=211228 RepID=A0AAJ7C7N7_CEPCN|nr:uncharacterized protein LOC107271665 isoform X2 [Cephus cinctus]
MKESGNRLLSIMTRYFKGDAEEAAAREVEIFLLYFFQFFFLFYYLTVFLSFSSLQEPRREHVSCSNRRRSRICRRRSCLTLRFFTFSARSTLDAEKKRSLRSQATMRTRDQSTVRRSRSGFFPTSLYEFTPELNSKRSPSVVCWLDALCSLVRNFTVEFRGCDLRRGRKTV